MANMIWSVGEMTKPFKSFDKETKQRLADDAASILKRSTQIKKDIKTIKADKELLAAAKDILREEIAEGKKALAT